MKADWTEILQKAQNGEPEAQLMLAQRFWLGEDTKRDLDRALSWFRLAASSGKPRYLKALALVLCDDDSGPDNFAEGFECMLKAAQAGDSGAQYFVASEYANGDRMNRSPELAAKWYATAAAAGHGEAEYNLGVMHLEGDGVSRDVAKGLEHITAAAHKGDYLARDFLYRAYSQGFYGLPIDAERAKNWRDLSEKSD